MTQIADVLELSAAVAVADVLFNYDTYNAIVRGGGSPVMGIEPALPQPLEKVNCLLRGDRYEIYVGPGIISAEAAKNFNAAWRAYFHNVADEGGEPFGTLLRREEFSIEPSPRAAVVNTMRKLAHEVEAFRRHVGQMEFGEFWNGVLAQGGERP